MPSVPNDPEVVALLRNPEYRQQVRRQLATTPRDPHDGSQTIVITDAAQNIIRTLKAVTPRAPA